MKSVLCWLALGVIPGLGQTGGGHVAPFALYARFEHDPPGPVLDAIKGELDAVMASAGMRVEWRSLNAPEGETAHELAVISFKGNCNSAGLIHEPKASGPLGWTHVTDGEVLAFSEVDCSQVRGFLARALLHLREEERERTLGRAVARVLAHELYHVLTRSRHHGPSGVAEPAYTQSELLGSSFAFAESDQKALASRLLSYLKKKKNPKDQPVTGPALFTEIGCIQCHGRQGMGGAMGGTSVRIAGQGLATEQLAARLADKDSRMYRQARETGRLWPELEKSEIESLVNFLNTAL